ncbi:MAG: hypothetical protein NTW96_03405 [Planctomycetia bacterium]|nr:hypothetical protein [Planctomycetia bacterium]
MEREGPDREHDDPGISSGKKHSVPFSPQLAGFPSETGHNGPEPGPVGVRPLSTPWLSDERIAEARRVWSKAYGRVISVDEAMEILRNVRRLAEVLLRAEEEGKTPWAW